MDPLLGVVGRGQLASQIRQLGRGVRGAPAARLPGRRLELSGDTLVRPLRGEREVSRPLLLVDHHRREPPVSLPPLVPGRHRVLNGREQRVGRPDAPGARLDHTVVEGSFDVVFGIRASDRLRDQRSGGLRRGRRDQEHVPDRIGEPGQADRRPDRRASTAPEASLPGSRSIPLRRRARPSSNARKGFPAAVPWIWRRTERGRRVESSEFKRSRVASCVIGPTSSRWIRSSGSARSRPSGSGS